VTLSSRPAAGRVFEGRRRVRLSDADATGRLRLDAVARYLQDIAGDDVADAGWSRHDGAWVVRRTAIEIECNVSVDETVELATWCSGIAPSAAARRTSLRGDLGGRIDTETIWIHLDRDGRPARHGEHFLALYGPSAAGRRASTRLSLPDPPAGAVAAPWPFRKTDVDVLGHVNNAAFWAPVEERLGENLRAGATATLEYRRPVDLADEVHVRVAGDRLWLTVGADVRAAAEIRSG
jgi:acyl-ACP thioesterase